MACAERYLARLMPGCSYHIYNRTNNKEKLFRNDFDRHCFLKRYKKYLDPFLITCAYCLPDTHFHFVVKIKSQSDIIDYLKALDASQLTQKEKKLLQNPDRDLWVDHFIEWQFLRFFTSYAMYINTKYKRKGNLFSRPFKRVEINDNCQFSQAIFYVHSNPVHHGITAKLEDYEWSSYNSILSDGQCLVDKEFVLNWFGGIEKFREFHRTKSMQFDQLPFYLEG